MERGLFRSLRTILAIFFRRLCSPISATLVTSALATGTDRERRDTEASICDDIRFSAVADTLPVAIALYEADRIVCVNDYALTMTGYSREELGEMNFWDWIHPDYRDLVKERGQARLTGKKVTAKYEVMFVKKSGEARWADLSAGTILHDGKPTGVAMLSDVTDRKRAEDALRESEEKFRVLADMSPAAIGVFQDDKIVYVNDSTVKLTGYSKAEISRMNFWDWYRPESKEMVKERGYAKQRGEPTPGRLEIELITKSGEIKWIDIAAGNIVYNGKPAGLAMLLDITDRKRAEIALRESEEKFRVLADTAPAAIMVYQGDKFQYVNDYASAMVGYSKSEFYEMDFWDWFDPAFQRITKERGLARQRGEKVPSRYEIRYVTRAGETRWADLSAGMIMYGGKPAGVAMLFDITDRKRAEIALRESEEKFRVLADASPAAIMVYQGTKFTYVNDSTAVLSGYSKQELFEMDFWSWIHSDDRELVKDRGLARQRGEKLPGRYEIKFVRKEGETRWADLAAGYIVFEGKPAGVAMLLDITERKKAEEELEVARDRAELYIDLMGHDITNLNQKGMGYLDLALNLLDLTGDTRELIEKPRESLNDSSRLIANIMELRKIESEKIAVRRMDVGKILEELAASLARTYGDSVQIKYSPAAGCLVNGNELLADIFSTIVYDSIKFSDRPALIEVEVRQVQRDDGRYCQVTIDDHSKGIPEKLKPLIFAPIRKGMPRTGGLEIDMYLVKKLAELFGGQVWVEDRVPGEYEKGSRFIVTLPTAN